ncbi:hypothetical protein [uncultured Paraglaciecola sp.]|uniref:hypothetical protein n=1 Tax=uncultured Paraglaciecola sp. TaxID=1765024 RepID=UPI00262E7E9A|nr:hypothetical protein [uncultured Paraglaciecola sp.]
MSDLQISVIIFSLLAAAVITHQDPLPCEPPRWHIVECYTFEDEPLRMRVDGITIIFEDIEQREYFLNKNQPRCGYLANDSYAKHFFSDR